MALTSAITNQVARAVINQATGPIKSGLKSLTGGGSGGSSDTRALANTGGGTKNLSYPLNVEGDEQQGHYIMFMINAAEQPKIGKGGAGPGASGPPGRGHQIGAPPQKNQEAFRRGKGAGQSLAAKRPASFRLDTAISLYMPPSVKVAYKLDYGDAQIGQGAEFAVQSGAKIIEAFSGGGGMVESMKRAGTAATEIGKSAMDHAGVWMADAAMGAMDKMMPGGAGSSALMQIGQGAIIGSKFELQFRSVTRRTFSFEFSFLPKSEAEVMIVEKIVQTFKRHSMPRVMSSISLGGINIKNNTGRILSIPDTFDIQYMYIGKENPFLNKISTCYLESIDVTSGGDKFGTFEPTAHPVTGHGPPPMKTSLSLGFREIEIMNRDRIEDGY